MQSPTNMSTSSDENNDSQFPSLSLKKQSSLVQTKNNHLNCMDSDCLYHLGLCKENAEDFSQVKYVCIGGTNDRMVKFAKQVAKTLELPESEVKSVGIHKRYVIYLVGPVLVCSHGMGGPSISILLNEIAKLLKYAKADACWLSVGRGSCGECSSMPGGGSPKGADSAGGRFRMHSTDGFSQDGRQSPRWLLLRAQTRAFH